MTMAKPLILTGCHCRAVGWRRTPRRQRQHGRKPARAEPLCSEIAGDLSPEQQEQWAACRDVVQLRSGLEAGEVDLALEKAFGWRGQGFWRQERVKDPPCQEQVDAALNWLAQLGIAETDSAAIIKAFPEVLGLKVELMDANVGVLRDKWSMKGNVLINAIKRKPRVVGNIIDCEGNCAGLCTRCWAQF